MSLKIIKEVVEQHFKIDITTQTRKREIVEARALYFYLARRYTRVSLSSIGKSMGRDHSTVLYFTRKVPDWIRFDYEIKKDYEQINERILDIIHAHPEEFKSAITIEGFYETQYKRLINSTKQINQDQLTIS